MGIDVGIDSCAVLSVQPIVKNFGSHARANETHPRWLLRDGTRPRSLEQQTTPGLCTRCVVSGSRSPHTRERTFSYNGSVICVRGWYAESLADRPLFFGRWLCFEVAVNRLSVEFWLEVDVFWSSEAFSSIGG